MLHSALPEAPAGAHPRAVRSVQAPEVPIVPRPSAAPRPRAAGTPGAAPFSPLRIDQGRCKGCELCVRACPHDVLAIDPAVVNPLGYHPIRLTDPDGCTSCVLCVRVCPDAVFTVYARPKAI